MADSKKKTADRGSRSDKFIWKESDVKIYKSESEWRKANKSKKSTAKK